MRKALVALSLTALVLNFIPAILFLSGELPLSTVKNLMLAATVVWFSVTPLWMGRSPGNSASAHS